MYQCPPCRRGSNHTLCSDLFCDCKHDGVPMASSTPNQDAARKILADTQHPIGSLVATVGSWDS